MNTFIVVFNFNDWDGHMSVKDSLEEHSQIATMMQHIQAVQLAPNAFVVRTELDERNLLHEFTPFLDRAEDIFVLAASTPYSAVAQEHTLALLDSCFDGVEDSTDLEIDVSASFSN
jgi:hypothetical protein